MTLFYSNFRYLKCAWYKLGKMKTQHLRLRHQSKAQVILALMSVLVCLAISSQNAFTQAIDYQNKTISLALKAEPPNLNTLESTDQISFFVIEHIMEGLVTYDQNRNLVSAIAEKWQIDEKGATFWLREDAVWSNGDRVTAHDFVFAWRKVVDPATASRYAFIMSTLKNAEKINLGLKSPLTLGVNALDDFTLKVEFERPCPYFLSLASFVSYFPVNQKFYEGQDGKYFSDTENMVFNGPYQLTEWVHGSSLLMVKNKSYWDHENIKINAIKVPHMTPDPAVRFNLFRDGEIVSAELGSDTLKIALHERMNIKKFLVGALFYLEFNQRDNRLSANKNLRKAVQAVFDADELVNKIIGKPGNYTAYGIFPRWLKGLPNEGESSSFQDDFPAERPNLNIALAKQYLSQAKKELGVKKIPPLVLLSSDSALATKQSAYLQNILKKHLDLDLRIDQQIFKQRLERMSKGEFDITLAAWGPDFNDPLTFADLFYSKNHNNHGRYNNKQYDQLIDIVKNTLDPKIRLQAFSEMQALLFEDAVVLPQFEKGMVYVEHPDIKGVVRRIFGGDRSYRYATIENKVR